MSPHGPEIRCGTCSAFARTDNRTGTCRAKPPQGIPHVGMNPVSRQPDINLLGGWPPVAENEWCRPGPNGWQPSHDNTN